MDHSNQLSRTDLYWLTGWLGVGVLLRVVTLALKSVWGDEWATLVFSLGHSFRAIPLNQLLDLDVLIEPIRYDVSTPIASVSARLIAESNHPPLYYWLTHLWLGLWTQDGDFISVVVGRSPAALFGVVLIPLTFGVSWWLLRDRWAAHGGAIAMAIAPYGIYLSQEARHYTLAMVWMLLSYGCLVKIIQAQQQGKCASPVVYSAWFIVNLLGVASHYFMLLSLAAEGLVLLYYYGRELWWQRDRSLRLILPIYWRPIAYLVLLSGALILVLLNHWHSENNDELTTWLNQDYGWGWNNLMPPGRSLLWLLGMVFMLPVEGSQLWLVLISAIALLLLCVGFVPVAVRFGRQNWQCLESRILISIILANLLILLGIVYHLKLDLSLAPRYYFLCFPPLMLLVGMLLAQLWQGTIPYRFLWLRQNRAIALLLVAMMFLSSICVNADLAYRKPENNQAIAQALQQNINWEEPTIFVTHYFEIAVTRTQMGLAWALHHLDPNLKPQFLILDTVFQPDLAPKVLTQTITNLTEPTQIITFNTHFAPPENLCPQQTDAHRKVTGYSYRLYHCFPTQKKSLPQQTP